MEYDDFEILIAPLSESRYTITVTDSSKGKLAEEVDLSFSPQNLKDLLIMVEDTLRTGEVDRSSGERLSPVVSSEQPVSIQTFGKSLFDALMTGDILSTYRRSWEEAWKNERGLRLRLRIQASELAVIPWEFLYDKRSNFLSLSPNTPIVRYLEALYVHPTLQVTPPLRILGLVASPNDLAELNVDVEKARIEEGLKPLIDSNAVELEWIKGDTWEELYDHVQQRKKAWHIFHFIGHGGYSRQREQGYIALTDKDSGNSKHLYAEDLSNILADHRSLRLVLLNACDSAKGNGEDLFSSTASQIVHRGIPAALAMQYPISDKAAIQFARTFYGAIAKFRPVDAAVADARAALKYSSDGMYEWGTPVLYMSSKDSTIFKTTEENPSVYLGFQSLNQQDKNLAAFLHEQLGASATVYPSNISEAENVQQLHKNLDESNHYILLLSEESVKSEYVRSEAEKAFRLFKAQGHPKILPIRLNYNAALTYPFSNLSEHAFSYWRDDTDTDRVLGEIKDAMGTGSLPYSTSNLPEAMAAPQEVQSTTALTIKRPHPIHPVELKGALAGLKGAMDPQSKLYIQRECDALVQRELESTIGATVVIKGPRQIGKSSLLSRIQHQAYELDKPVAFVDFQEFDNQTLLVEDLFYRRFCATLSEELEIPNRVAEIWQEDNLGNKHYCRQYLTYLFKQIDEEYGDEQPRLLLAMDEVERIFSSKFRSDFFGMLRSWHNRRARPSRKDRIFKRLDLVLVTSTEPYMFIQDLDQSPFNVAVNIDIDDFNLEQVAELNELHGSPFSLTELGVLHQQLNGHPFLTRLALYEAASGIRNPDVLLKNITSDGGPFEDHLRTLLAKINTLSIDNPEEASLLNDLTSILKTGQYESEQNYWRLRGAGLVRSDGQEGRAVPRCEVYRTYFTHFLT